MIPTVRHIAHSIVKNLQRIRLTENATFVLILMIGLAATSSAAFADATPDHFEELGALPLARVKSFDVEGTTISLLFDQTVALSNTAFAGTRMSVRSLTPLRQSYDNCTLHDGRLILYSRSGDLGLAGVDVDTLVVVNEQTFGDSIFSVAIGGNYLYLAQGFDGIKVVDIGDLQVLRTVGKADHGGYYFQLAVRDTLLLAVDRLNGVDVFRIRDSALVYLRTLLTDWPVIDFAFDDDAIIICYGNKVVDRRQLDGSQGVGDVPLEFDRRVFHLEDFGRCVITVFDNGMLQSYYPRVETALGSSQLVYPAKKVRSAVDDYQQRFCYVLDETGNLTGLLGEELSPTKELKLTDLPAALVATDRGLVISRAGRGLFLLAFEDGAVIEELLFETGLGFSSLCYQDSLLFCGVTNSDSVMVFNLSDCGVDPLMVADMGRMAKQLYVRRRGTYSYDLTAINSDGARAVRVNVKQHSTDPLWQTPSRFLVNNGYCDGSSLILSSETGDIDYYCLDCGFPRPILRGSVAISSSPRSLLIIDSRFLIAGSESGASLFSYSQSQGRFDPIGDLLPINSVSQFLFDPAAQLLVVASGEDGIRYVDLTDPYQPSAVFPIRASGKATAISLWGDRLYALESDAIRCYRSVSEGLQSSSSSVFVSEPFPNPFNSGTVIDVAPSGAIRISFQILDILGRVVRGGELDGGAFGSRIAWDGTDSGNRPVASGVYFLRLVAGKSVSVRKMLLVK
ncbi:MAG: T9SS type A sorting domain-containing protein [candidate division Zixibacteria bacterium]|nr:T9SS type A sorting domain-containing protein [candidate division Zixibacteria bacterium]